MGATLSGPANTHLAADGRRRPSLDGTKTTAAKIAKDMKKLTTAAAKLKLKSKPIKVVKCGTVDAALEKEKENVKRATTSKPVESLPVPAVKRETRPEYRLSDLCIALGRFVHGECSHVSGPTEVVQWIRIADRALQLNGWTLNSFLCESHIVFTFMLVRKALAMFDCKNAIDVKQLFLMCLYISYTYNANEISYPLKPFLVNRDRSAFWDKCVSLSMETTSDMLQLNQDQTHYSRVLKELRNVVSASC